MSETSSRSNTASATGLLVALTLASTLSPLNSTTMAVAIPAIGRYLALDPAVLTQWLVSSYLLVSIVAQSPSGKLGDLWGHQRSLALGQGIFTLGSIVGGIATHAWMLVVARVLMAMGGAAITPAAIALVRDAVPAERRARAYGAFGASMGIAAALGPLVGGELTTRLGWRAIFLLNLPLLVGSALLARGAAGVERRAEARGSEPRRGGFDVVGSLLLAAGLASIVGGARAQRPLPLAAGLGLLVAFAVWERRAKQPVLDLSLFKRRAFTAGAMVTALMNLAMYATLFELPMFFARARGLGAAAAGRTLIAMMASSVIATPVGARMSERFGARAVALSGALISAAGAALLSRADAIVVPLDAAPALVLLGLGLGLAGSPSQAASMAAVDPAQAGMAAGAYSTMRYLGGVAGIAVLARVIHGADAASAMQGHAVAGSVFVISLVGAAVAAAFLPGERATSSARR